MSYHIVCDPVHGVMEFDEETKKIIKPLIDHIYFQRLRHIKQLSFAEYAYPGAVHTRFNHCIGVAYLASCVSTILGLKELKIVSVVAGLLHDIGHGPFSHAFEGIYGESSSGKALNVKHEKWNEKFISTLKEEVNEEIKNILVQIEKIMYSSETLSDEEQLVKQIISSQLDVDRFDYLLRDSHFSGVSYGHFDVHWLIANMRRDKNKIVVTSKGVRAVEHYLMARRLMNHNVYYHKKKCGAEYLLLVFFELLSRYVDNVSHKINAPFLGFIKSVNAFKNTDKFENNIIENCFDIYSKLNDHDVWHLIAILSTIDDFPELKEISLRFLSRRLPEVFQVNTGKESYVQEQIKARGFNGNWRFKCYNPCINIYKLKAEEIFVLDKKNAESKPINELMPYSDILNYSNVLGSLSDKSEDLMYLYYIEDAEGSTIEIDKFIKELKLENNLLGY